MIRRYPLCLLIAAFAGLPAAAAQAAAKPLPDLRVARAQAGLGTAAAGSTVRTSLVVKNAGRRKARASVAALYLSKDARRGRGDARVARLKVPALKRGRAAKVAATARIPSGAKPGAYRLLACADVKRAVREAREAGNCARRPLRVTGAVTSPTDDQPPAAPGPAAVAADAPAPAPEAPAAPGDRPDLQATDVSDPPATAVEGSGFALTDAVANTGAAAPPTAIRFYLSPDSERSLQQRRESGADPRAALDDVLLGGAREVPGLPAGGRSDAPAPGTEVTVPFGTRPGVYHLLACADDRAAATEAVEDANCAVATRPVDGVERPSRIEVLAEAQEYRVDALSDVFEDAADDDEESLEGGRGAFCAPRPHGTATTVDEALASVRAYVAQNAGPGAMAQFAASPEHADADRAETAAAAAVLTKRPTAALAALVRAHELQPWESSHLVNAAAVASSVGLPAEALAMLDGANRLDDPDPPAMGISRHAVALANRGQALALLGRHAEAESAADAALRAEPLVSEAHATRALSSLCREGAGAAVPHARKSRTRQGRRPLDASGGKETKLRELQLPAFTKQAAAMKPYYVDERERDHQQIADMNARQATFAKNVRDKQDGWTRAQVKRYFGIFDHLHDVDERPDIVAKHDEFRRQVDLAWETIYDFWGYGNTTDYRYHEISEGCSGPDFERCMRETCRPALNTAHQEWLDHVQSAHDAGQAFVRAYSKRYSALASHLADPDAFGEAMIGIEARELSVYSALTQLAFHWTHDVGLHSDHCVESPEPPGAEPGTPPEVETGGACSAQTKTLNWVAELGPSKTKVSCERVQQSLKWEAMPWLQAFAEGSYDFKTGRLTILAGSKGEVSAGVGKGTFKSGIYITIDSNGDVYDAGWRVGPSATVGSGPVEVQPFKDEIDISFIGGPKLKFGE